VAALAENVILTEVVRVIVPIGEEDEASTILICRCRYSTRKNKLNYANSVVTKQLTNVVIGCG
jgi:hypothetical protein